MHQWDWELVEAQRVLARALADDPREGYTHQLVAATLAHGLGLGEETVAVYRHLAGVQTGNVDHLVHSALASLEAHRRDRFLGPAAPWYLVAMAELAEIAANPAFDERARFEALIARRNLLFLMKDPTAARREGMAAHELLPGRLQGRITALAQARRDQDLMRQVDLCIDIIRTDPWAVEACSIAAAGDVELINSIVAVLHERAITDPVIANELHKYYKRTKQQLLRQQLIADVRAVQTDFVPVDARRWYSRGGFGGSRHYDLLRGSNQSLSIEDLTERMARLDELGTLVPDPLEVDLGVERWLRARYVTAQGLEADEVERTALTGLCEVSLDPEWCMTLAAETEGVEALEAIQKALEGVEYHLDWVPAPRGRAGFDFTRWATAQTERRDAARAREAELLAALPDRAPYDGPLAAAWPAMDDPAGWAQLALRDDLSDGLRVHAALHAAALSGPDRPPGEWLAGVLPTFERTFPMIGAAGVDPSQAFLAASEVRRAILRAGPRPDRADHPLVGSAAPALEVTDLTGHPISLEALAGRVVLIDFWATWCAPCVEELPELQALVDRLEGEPVTLVALSVDDTEEPVRPFLEARGFTFDVAWIAASGVKQEWMVRGIPSLFVVGPDGIVRYHHQGFRKGVGGILEAEVRALLDP
jgi:thiol-disulfide isomerase/thioredoxin